MSLIDCPYIILYTNCNIVFSNTNVHTLYFLDKQFQIFVLLRINQYCSIERPHLFSLTIKLILVFLDISCHLPLLLLTSWAVPQLALHWIIVHVCTSTQHKCSRMLTYYFEHTLSVLQCELNRFRLRCSLELGDRRTLQWIQKW